MRSRLIKKVLISKYFTINAFEKIKEALTAYHVEQVSKWQKDESADAVIIRSKDLVHSKFLTLYPNVKIVVSATSGFDHFDFKTLKESNIKACYSPNANVNSATEITLFHILNFFKKGQNLLSKKPTQRTREVLGSELTNKKIVIIGLGRIGTLVSKTLNILGCKIFAYDPYINPQAFINAGASSVTLDEAFQKADVISLHCPLTKLTKGLINETNLSKLKPNTLLVNCARGELINSEALIKALESGKLMGACLDVFDREPLSSSSPLLKLGNVITTPHIGSYTTEAQEKSALEAAQQVRNWFEVDPPVLSSIPPDVAWKNDLEE